MKMRQLMVTAAATVLLAGTVCAQTTNSFSFNVSNGAVPDGNPVGLTLPENVTGLSGVISDVTLSLNVAGGFNGDLYAYLSGPNGGFAVLLNRAGISGSGGNSVGYSDTGFDLTFDDTATMGASDIHFYQTEGGLLNGNGQLTGTWASDARNINPLSAPGAFDTASRDASLSTLDNMDPNGTWTLFLADLSSGGQSTVASWGLNITTVPEPSAFTLMCLGVVTVFLMILYRKRQRCEAE